MCQLQVTLFGRFAVHCHEHVLEGFDAYKVQELFCWLLLFHDRMHYRETLADLLWDETSTAQSKRYLSKTLWKLQTVLDTEVQSLSAHLLQIEPDWIQLNLDEALCLDVAIFDKAFTVVEGIPGYQLEPQQARVLQDAMKLYRGDLLEGWYQDWCIFERERRQQAFLSMLDKLMRYCEACAEYERGLEYGGLILRYDRARELTHRQLMRLQYLAGDRTGALRQYRQCVTALEEELGVRPARLTELLYQQLQADNLGEPISEVAQGRPSTMRDTSTLRTVFEHIKQLQTAAVMIHAELQTELEAVEGALQAFMN